MAHTFHIRLTPDTQNSVIELVEAIQTHLGGGLQVNDCLEITTDRDDIACAIGALFGAPKSGHAPAAAVDEPKKKRRKRTVVDQPAGEPAAITTNSPDQITGENLELPQVMLWRILDTDRELNSISMLLATRKLQPGQRLQNRNKGLFEVFETHEGKLGVRPARMNGQHQQLATEAQR